VLHFCTAYQLALLPFDGLPIGRWREREHAPCGAPESNILIAFVLNVLRVKIAFRNFVHFDAADRAMHVPARVPIFH
jgi:hypothetical protein